MADHGQASLAVPALTNQTKDDKAQSYLAIDGSVGTGAGGGAAGTTYYDMCGHDSSCSAGSALHTWRVTGSPDLAGASAGSLPCGGPLVDIFVCRTFTA